MSKKSSAQTALTVNPNAVVALPIQPLMERSYVNYAVSVITDRALPDVRDGLKPVHRRILYAMYGLGMRPGSQFKKSARMVGDVIGKYHPHGDISVYDAAVNMAQPWRKRIPLIDGQGNFGSVDGDSPAAMRYTEMRTTKASWAFFDDVEKDTVDYQPNYDGSETEPVVLPVTYPNVWVNGVEGIAVGMATNVLPHNLNETVDALIAWMKNPAITIDDILAIMPGPDFPTGGIVHELDGYRNALETGKGRVRVRAKYHVEKTKRGQDQLILDELPYGVNKARLHATLVEMVKNKVLEDVTMVRDESSKGENRLVLDIKKGSYPEVVFNQIIAQTEAETAFSYNVMLLDGKRPRQLGILEIFERFAAFRREVIQRRTQFLLRQARARLHILSGFIAALSRLDETIATIRANKNSKEANEALQQLLSLDQAQAQAILSLQLSSLTGLQIDEIRSEFNTVSGNVANYEAILASPEKVDAIIVDELLEAKQRYGDARKTEISHDTSSITMADMVKKEPCLVHMTHNGYIKRMPATQINVQNRYTQGRAGIVTGDDDYVQSMYSGSTHDLIMLFSEEGVLRAKRAWQIPEGTNAQKGRHIRNLFDDFAAKIQSCIFVPSLEEPDVYLVTVTEKGKIKRTALSEYGSSLRRAGIQALNVEDGDKFVAAAICREHDHIMLGLSDGRVIRFEVNPEQFRAMGRTATGVRAVRLVDDAKVISLMVVPGNGVACPLKTVKSLRDVDGVETEVDVEIMDTDAMDKGRFLLCVGKKGPGKRTPISDYLTRHRAGQGVLGFTINKKTGPIVAMALVTEDNDVVLTTQSKTNRLHVSDIRITGRVAAGSYIMDIAGEEVMDVSVVPRAEDVVDDGTGDVAAD